MVARTSIPHDARGRGTRRRSAPSCPSRALRSVAEEHGTHLVASSACRPMGFLRAASSSTGHPSSRLCHVSTTTLPLPPAPPTHFGSTLDSTVRELPTFVEKEQTALAATHFAHGFSCPHCMSATQVREIQASQIVSLPVGTRPRSSDAHSDIP